MVLQVDFLGEWKANEEEVKKNLQQLKQGLDFDAIHDLRVAIKKLRAYTRLLAEIDPSVDEAEALAETEKLFDVFGKHREWEIAIDKTVNNEDNKDNTLPMYFRYAHFSKEQVSPVLTATLATYTTTELTAVEQKIQLLTETLQPKQLYHECIEVLKLYINKIEKAAQHFKKNIHKVRKLLKKVLYWIHLFPEDSLYSKRQQELFDDFLDKLGKWHDYQVILEKTDCFKTHHLAETMDEFTAVENAESKLRKKMNRIYESMDVEEIIEELKNSKLQK